MARKYDMMINMLPNEMSLFILVSGDLCTVWLFISYGSKANLLNLVVSPMSFIMR